MTKFRQGRPERGVEYRRGIKYEAQLSQRDCAILRAIKYFAKPPKVTQYHSK